jgi:hypothetical protein
LNGHNGPVSLTIRRAAASDAPFLAEMLLAAAFWRPDQPSGTVTEMLSQPQLAHYVAGWPRRGDLGVIALEERQPVGAAWVRLLPRATLATASWTPPPRSWPWASSGHGEDAGSAPVCSMR